MSGWASAESPLHAFSLPSSGEDAHRPSVMGVRWRQSFGELWDQIALGDLIGGHANPRRVGIRCRGHLEVVQRDLLALWKVSGASRRSVLRSAAMSLECSARVWQAFVPVAGKRQLHLVSRLEDTLLAAERKILAAELPVLVNRPMISLAARLARGAIDDLLHATVDPAEALATLEDAAVELASMAVRAAINLNAIGAPRERPGSQHAALGRQLEGLASEVSSTARVQRSAKGKGAEEDYLGVWLSATLSVAPPTEEINLIAAGANGDLNLRADAIYSLRARWLELAGGLWVIVQGLDDLLVLGTFADEARLRGALSSRAGSALVASDLCRRPGDFDHQQAWGSHREGLYELVSDTCLALQTCEPDAVVRSQQLALRRLARALAAIWTIDERLRVPSTQASSRCR